MAIEENFDAKSNDKYGGIPIHESLDEVLARLKATAAEQIILGDSENVDSSTTTKDESPYFQQPSSLFIDDTSETEEAEVQTNNPIPNKVNLPPTFEDKVKNLDEPTEFWTDEHEIPSGTRKVTGLEAFAIRRGLPTSHMFMTRSHRPIPTNESKPHQKNVKRLTVTSLGLLAAGAVVLGVHDIHGNGEQLSVSNQGGANPALAQNSKNTKAETGTASPTETRTTTSISRLAVGQAIISAVSKENTPTVDEKIKPVTSGQIKKVESINGIKSKTKATNVTGGNPVIVTPVAPVAKSAPLPTPTTHEKTRPPQNNGGSGVTSFKRAVKTSATPTKSNAAKKPKTSGGSGL
jgi:hypothetical protein